MKNIRVTFRLNRALFCSGLLCAGLIPFTGCLEAINEETFMSSKVLGLPGGLDYRSVEAKSTSGLSYGASEFVLTAKVPTGIIAPNSTYKPIIAYSISPNLPPGLAFHAGTGVISGTPTGATPRDSYVVTAISETKVLSATFSMQIKEIAPELYFREGPFVFIKGKTINSLEPLNSGSVPLSCTVSPDLPAGLSLTPSCVIVGTAAEVAPSTSYAITATNSGGSTTTFVAIEVIDSAPVVSFSGNPFVFTKGQPLKSIAPSYAGGAVTQCSANPSLPAGLILSAECVLSGTPTVVASEVSYLVTATNLAGSSTAALVMTVNDAAPSDLSYSSSTSIYVQGTAIVPNIPFSRGGAVVNYSISPVLLPGLSLDPSTGVITGVPAASVAAASYIVTASNPGGSTQAPLTITVIDVPPSNLSYSSNAPVYIQGAAISANIPSSTGGAVVTYFVTPELPSGLSLNATTGVITGTPTVLAPSSVHTVTGHTVTAHTVTAMNSGGSAQVQLKITVDAVAPSELHYSSEAAVYTKGTEISANTPISNGGPVVSYSVLPPLPIGLSLNPITGVISGTPTVAAARVPYVVTATNSGGSARATLNIVVNDQVQSNLAYSENPAVYTKNQSISANIPTSSGGEAGSYSISPDLPEGLSFNTLTGIITGTPMGVSLPNLYTVSAVNSGGSTQTILSITVKDIPPASFSYADSSVEYTKGLIISPNSPSFSGGSGEGLNFAISPALPEGLLLNSTTGQITGVPNVIVSKVPYTVTASNSGGRAQTSLIITVNDAAPFNLAYSLSSSTYSRGSIIAANTPSSAGGAVVSYAISPALPAGLLLNPTTGVIAGTPESIIASTAYTVTAANSGGTATALLNITVNDVAPSNLAYPSRSLVAKVGSEIEAMSPVSSGGAPAGYSVSPPLPSGLSLNSTSGEISGVPNAAAPSATYVVTGTNSGGSSQTTLLMTVIDIAPPEFHYSNDPAVYTLGSAILPNAPSSPSPAQEGASTSGAVLSYEISPSLPAGLSLNPTTGVISGIPTGIQPTTSYTVTASNSGGSAQAFVEMTVKDLAPSTFRYSSGSAIYTMGIPIAENSPIFSFSEGGGTQGGAVVRYSVSPELPSGLSLNPVTGVIAGIPSLVTQSETYTVTAENSGGSTQTSILITVNDVAPSGLSYKNSSVVYTVGSEVTPNVPSSNGGSATYSVLPPLPAGLSIHALSGVISGVPAAVMVPTSYVVTATNSGGSAQTTLDIAVNNAPPLSLSYSSQAATYTVGSQIQPNTPSVTGGDGISYGVLPPLPLGLSMDSSTGVIFGTPTLMTPRASYTITATNSGGSVQSQIDLTVNDIAPSSLSYSSLAAVYTKGVVISDNMPEIIFASVTPTLSGSTEVRPGLNYSIVPDLPAGLILNSKTGVISGTPVGMIPATSYRVTATNSGGSVQANLSIVINDEAQSGLTFSENPVVYTKGSEILPNTPSAQGGVAESYSISPTLPAGLSLDSLTGVISGTPMAVLSPAIYTVTATNSGGSTHTSLSLGVNDIAPSSFTYSDVSGVYTVGTAISVNHPLPNGPDGESGGKILNYAVSPGLPPGLAINELTGAISGTPTAVAPSGIYTVTATNSGGSVQTSLTIQVNDIAPSNLRYSLSSAVYTLGAAIPVNTPSTSASLEGGGAVSSYKVFPDLPPGLSINATTGVISGTPTAISPLTSYTITAMNSGGSAQTTLRFEVNDVPPSNLKYGVNPAIYVLGSGIPANASTSVNAPSSSGGEVTRYTVSPSLPPGLSIDLSTGVISGTPTVVLPSTPFSVTATNSGGATQSTLTIQVNDVAPSNLVYSLTPAIYTVGSPILANAPSSSSQASSSQASSSQASSSQASSSPVSGGGAVVSYAVSPSLPPGLSFDESTGVISGTPTMVASLRSYRVTATNSGGSTQVHLEIGVNDIPPSDLTYPDSTVVYTLGSAILANTPSTQGGKVENYSVSPALPLGLSLNASTGVISGTPTVRSESGVYTVSARNSGGSTQVILNISVKDLAPSDLIYSNASLVYILGTAVSSNAPTSGGGEILSYSVSPALPSGLSLNPLTGLISGIPTEVTPTSSYLVTGTNTGGVTQTVLKITVTDLAPTGLSYPTSAVVYVKGTSVPALTPTSGGGAVVSYSVSSELPMGLSLNSSTGAIAGTPSGISPAGSYTVTATNSGGAAQTSLSIVVNDEIQSGLTYSLNPAVYTKGSPVPPNTPTASGGAAENYSIYPPLPDGLSFNTLTGVISGVPASITAPAFYTITSTNSGGSVQTTLSLTVNDNAPSGLVYSDSSRSYSLGSAIPENSPFSTGGAVVSYTVTPPLPSGLSLNASTGVISGTPTELSAAAPYIVTAVNTGGSAQATLTLAVHDVAPANLSYSNHSWVYTRGAPISANTPSSSGGAIERYMVYPDLPAGLSINGSTGVISGTPTEIAPLASYTVTATNSGGSTQAVLKITVNDLSPADLKYASSLLEYTKGIEIPPAIPTSNGGAVVNYTITPALPWGLSLNSETGVMTGTPTEIMVPTSYTITALNSGGSNQTVVRIQVNDMAPSNLNYTHSSMIYTKNVKLFANTPSVMGGTPVSYAVSPLLPLGLSLDPSSGIISGAPTVLTPATSYTVTATNSGGSAQTFLNITVNDVAPSGLSYSTENAIYKKGSAILANSPSSDGGAVVSYVITPALPSGLFLNPETGVITGASLEISPSETYTVTAANSGGSTSTSLTIAINDVVPSNLTYSLNPAIYTKGSVITDNSPASDGGAVTTYSVSPPLPEGLSLNPATGVLSGTPSQLARALSYTVTATNSGGSTTADVNLTVIDVAPAGLSYSSNPVVYTKGLSIEANSPASSGGMVTRYAVIPALPAGLELDPDTGRVTGTPSVIASSTSYIVTGSNSGGSVSSPLNITVNDLAPSALIYSNPDAIYTKGSLIVANAPSSSGGAVTSYSISPALPGDLALNPTTGVIFGIPSAVIEPRQYTVTASNSGGSTSSLLSITVNDVAPSNLSYSDPSPVYTKGSAIADNNPTSSGGIVTLYSVFPPLPPGLSLEPSSGTIKGTPAAMALPAPYLVTATNSGGSASVSLNITVNDVAPSSLTYSLNPSMYTKGSTISDNVPSSGGGSIDHYSIFPALPLGLSFNTATGIISGTPAAVAGSVSYLVTGSGSGGFNSTSLLLAVNDIAPSSLTYSSPSAVYTKGTVIGPNTPASSGGPVLSYSVSPSLPSGLTLNSATGVISGMPAAVSATSAYTVTASNSGGSVSSNLVLTVNDTPPSSLAYSSNPGVYTKGVAISANTPSVSGGAAIGYSISPALPLGLAFNTATGVITGTPSSISPFASYTVTAMNSGGSSSVRLDLTVNDVGPSNLSYSSSSSSYTKGTAISNNIPSVSGGAVISYSILPSLPSGLSLNTTTGVISGNPTAIAPSTIYVVTATNSGGTASANLNITVNDITPYGLRYSSQTDSYTKNIAILPKAPSSSGGAVVNYSVIPALPTGLALNSSTGLLSGTPSTLSPSNSYTVTATNSGGSTQTTLNIAVVDAVPSGLSYSSNPAVYTKGSAIPSNSPSSSGGTIVTYSISPSLPSGLSLNSTSGIISGTPTQVSLLKSYIVTATNSGGSATATLDLTVNDIPPSNLVYGISSATYLTGVMMTSNIPSSSGGPVVSYSVSPVLPTGMAMNSSTGVISGTPTTPTAASVYTVTAMNSGGSTSTNLTIGVTVPDTVMTAFAYPASSYSLKPNVAVSISPTIGGGTPSSCSASPYLPSGLSINGKTCAISGTPTGSGGQSTLYTITASNSINTLVRTITLGVVGETQLWTWVSGSNGLNQGGVYGTKGVASSLNVPSFRSSSVSCMDLTGNLWVFGGFSYNQSDSGVLNDLWKWDGTNWTWVSGSTAFDQKGVYGTKGVVSSSNVPRGRFASAVWEDSSGNCWIIGGYHSDGLLNDLWKWSGTNWTWVSGSTSFNSNGVYGKKGVTASSNVPRARYSFNAAFNSSAEVTWIFGGNHTRGNLNDLWKWDGTNWTWVSGSSSFDQAGVYGTRGIGASSNVPGARSDANSWIDSIGNLWVFGGVGGGVGNNGFLNDLWKWDGTNWTWVSGSTSGNQPGAYGIKGTAASSNAPGGRSGSRSWVDSSGDVWLFGGWGNSTGTSFGFLNDLWQWDGTNWTWVSGSNSANQPAVYGMKGVASPSSLPGGRHGSAASFDSRGSVWVFGGWGLGGLNSGMLNDLWKFTY